MKNRHVVGNKDRKKYFFMIKDAFPDIDIPSKSKMEIAKIEDFDGLIIDNSVDFLVANNSILLTIHAISNYKPKTRWVTVDEGAIRFIVNGADVMAPGIVDADKDIRKGYSVWVRDEKHSTPLASGTALLDGSEMIKSSSGKAVKNLHHVGDTLWKFFSKSL